MLKDKFETTGTGRGSEAHKKYLKEEIKKGLKEIRLQKILDKLKELNDWDNTIDDMREPPFGTTRGRGYRGHRHG